MSELIEMEYKTLLNKKPELLYNGEYGGYEYYITSMGSHPCAYIIIEPDDILFGKSEEELNIPVHGGITYTATFLSDWVTDKWVIGWDYWHYGDYDGITGPLLENMDVKYKKWTTLEIKNEVIEAIDYILKAYKK